MTAAVDRPGLTWVDEFPRWQMQPRLRAEHHRLWGEKIKSNIQTQKKNTDSLSAYWDWVIKQQLCDSEAMLVNITQLKLLWLKHNKESRFYMLWNEAALYYIWLLKAFFALLGAKMLQIEIEPWCSRTYIPEKMPQIIKAQF